MPLCLGGKRVAFAPALSVSLSDSLSVSLSHPSKETYYSVKRDLLSLTRLICAVCCKWSLSSCKRDLLQCQKRPTLSPGLFVRSAVSGRFPPASPSGATYGKRACNLFQRGPSCNTLATH